MNAESSHGSHPHLQAVVPEPQAGDDAQPTGGDDRLVRQLDRILKVQQPAAAAMARRMRRQNPQATPAQLMAGADRWFRRTAMGTGAGVGAAAVVPGIGTATGIALAGAEIVTFLELTALYALTMAELAGASTGDPERARTLVMAIMLGERGRALVMEVARNRTPAALMSSPFWGGLITSSMPSFTMGELGQRMRRAFVQRFANRQATGAVGKIIPFGIGAAVGAFGNRALANEVIRTARSAFGNGPEHFRGALSDEALAARDASRALSDKSKDLSVKSKPKLRALLPGKRRSRDQGE